MIYSRTDIIVFLAVIAKCKKIMLKMNGSAEAYARMTQLVKSLDTVVVFQTRVPTVACRHVPLRFSYLGYQAW